MIPITKVFVGFFPAIKSIDRYRQIEKASGHDFFNEVGFLTIRNSEEEERWISDRNQNKISYNLLLS